MQETTSLVTHIPPPKTGRRFAVSDIHGCARTLKFLLEEELKLTKDDQLFPLGDYIDRGPRSGEVIDYLLDLMEEGFHIYPLMGNHEDMFLDSYHENFLKINQPDRMHQLYEHYNARDLFGEDGWPKKRYLNFMQHLHYCIDVGDGYLVHAHLKPGINMFRDLKTMLWARQTTINANDLDGKWMLYGHTPTDIRMIRKLIANRNFKIPLDNGCVFADGLDRMGNIDLGRLCALNLDTFELHEVANKDI